MYVYCIYTKLVKFENKSDHIYKTEENSIHVYLGTTVSLL